MLLSALALFVLGLAFLERDGPAAGVKDGLTIYIDGCRNPQFYFAGELWQTSDSVPSTYGDVATGTFSFASERGTFETDDGLVLAFSAPDEGTVPFVCTID